MNVSNILNTYYGVPVNQWTRLSDIITVISLDQEANIYTDPDELYYFNTSTNILSISKNYKYHLLTKIEAQGSYKPYIYIDMNKISGFISTSVVGPYGIIMERPY